jgi:hypothetical protein
MGVGWLAGDEFILVLIAGAAGGKRRYRHNYYQYKSQEPFHAAKVNQSKIIQYLTGEWE